MVPVNLRPDDEPLPAELGQPVRAGPVLAALRAARRRSSGSPRPTDGWTAIKDSPEAWLTFGHDPRDRPYRPDARALPGRLLRQQGHRRHHQRPRPATPATSRATGSSRCWAGRPSPATRRWAPASSLRRPRCTSASRSTPHDHRPRGFGRRLRGGASPRCAASRRGRARGRGPALSPAAGRPLQGRCNHGVRRCCHDQPPSR